MGGCDDGGSSGDDAQSPVGDWGEAGDAQDSGGRWGGSRSPCALDAGGWGSDEGGGGCEEGDSPLSPAGSFGSGGSGYDDFDGGW